MATRDLSRGSEQLQATTDGSVIAWMRGRVAELGIGAVVSERHLRAYLEHFGDPETAVAALASVVRGKPFRA